MIEDSPRFADTTAARALFETGLPVRDLVAFYNERVDIEVDGEPQERPRTQWSVH